MTLPFVTMQARAVTDCELKFATSGVAVAKVRCVATARKFNKDTNAWEDGDKFWVNVTGFKKLAENMAESITQGQLINVVGRIKTDEWETREGEKRSAPSILADTVGLALDWDAAKVLKSERVGGGGDPAPADDPWTTGGGTEEPPF